MLEYPQGSVDSQVHQSVDEYLSNQPQALAPQNDFSTQQSNEEFVMRQQPNEFMPQKQQQLQPNEFIGKQIVYQSKYNQQTMFKCVFVFF